MSDQQVKDPEADPVKSGNSFGDLSSDQVKTPGSGSQLDALLQPDHRGSSDTGAKHRQKGPAEKWRAATAAAERRHDRARQPKRPRRPTRIPPPAVFRRPPNHRDFTTEAWRNRHDDGELPQSRRRSRRGWRLRLRPYRRNPVRMLLERPRMIAILLLTLAFVLRVVEVQRAPYTPASDA